MRKPPWMCPEEDCMAVNKAESQKCYMCGEPKPDAAPPELCEDEGCMHAGTPHVCVSQPNPRQVAYDMIDRFLRDNLGDRGYAEYAEYLEALYGGDTK